MMKSRHLVALMALALVGGCQTTATDSAEFVRPQTASPRASSANHVPAISVRAGVATFERYCLDHAGNFANARASLVQAGFERADETDFDVLTRGDSEVWITGDERPMVILSDKPGDSTICAAVFKYTGNARIEMDSVVRSVIGRNAFYAQHVNDNRGFVIDHLWADTSRNDFLIFATQMGFIEIGMTQVLGTITTYQ